MNKTNVKPAEGKLGILVVGNGAVATTFMTGVLMTRKGLTKPVGSMTQYDKIRVGRGASKQYLRYADIVPLASLDDIVFGCWDVYPQNAYQAAVYAEVLKEKGLQAQYLIGSNWARNTSAIDLGTHVSGCVLLEAVALDTL